MNSKELSRSRSKNGNQKYGCNRYKINIITQEKEQLVKKHAEELRKQIALIEEKKKQEERDK
jgi:hypothetical protein